MIDWSLLRAIGRHPNLARHIGIAMDPEGSPCIVTELAPLGSLHDVFMQRLSARAARVTDAVLITAAMQVGLP